MYEQVLGIEVAQLRNAFNDFYQKHNKPKPKLTFLVVQKRNHLRTAADQEGTMYNPPVGTLINTQVIDTERENFYLYSHFALQVCFNFNTQLTLMKGTAKPTHYQVLLDECQFKENIVPFTYGLAHLHQGCPRSISIPAPVFYADKACGRIMNYYNGAKSIPPSVQNGMMI
jgi:eukaryotic translation initiation factor 2C